MSKKVKNHQCSETCGESDTRRSLYACIVEAHKLTKKRFERTLPKDHEDHIAGKGFVQFVESFQSWCASLIPCLKQ